MIGVLIIISIWDLVKKEIPIPLLVAFSVISLIQMAEADIWDQMTACALIILMSSVEFVLVRKSKMGGGDVWVLGCLALAWPLEMFWQSIMNGILVLCVVALGVWALTQNENTQIPMVPFLLLGYWMRG